MLVVFSPIIDHADLRKQVVNQESIATLHVREHPVYLFKPIGISNGDVQFKNTILVHIS